MVQLNEELIQQLDRRAAREAVSRSKLIRQAVEAFLAADRDSELDRRIEAGYRRVPQGGGHDVDEWGDLGVAVTALTADTMRRLDQEERDAGFEPW